MFVARRTCHRLRRWLQHYLDGELDHATTVLVAQHLETCQTCGLQAHTYTQVKAARASGDGAVDVACDEALERLLRYAQGLSGPDGPSA